MKASTLLAVSLWCGLSGACGDNHDDKEWSKEELQELEHKWGFEVRNRTAILQ